MKTVLVVEDNEDIRELVVTVLRREGYGVLEADNGKRALELLTEHKDTPCLMLLDLMMPVMDGAQLIESLHASHAVAPLPIVVVSANERPADLPPCESFVRKPASSELILSLVREFCGPPEPTHP